MNFESFLRTYSVARKELLHILRDPQTLFFTLFVMRQPIFPPAPISAIVLIN